MKMRRLRPVSVLSLALLMLLMALSGYYAGPVEGSGSGSSAAEIAELEDMIETLDKSIENSRRKMDRLEAKIAAAEKQIEAAGKEIVSAEARLEESTRLFGLRVRSVYMDGGISYLEIILDADNFGDLIVRSAYLKKVADRDADLIASIKCERKLIAKRKKTIKKRCRELDALMKRVQEEYALILAQWEEKEKLLREAGEKTAGYKPVYGVVLDNSPPARPHSGLAEANMVYEFEVEGKITRYLALFSFLPTKVGPVRSARTHSATLALENGVHYIYAGGTKDVLNMISGWGLRNTSALASGSSAIYRSSDRRAPHNLYVNLARLGKESPSDEPLIRPAFLDREGKPGSTVSLVYNSFTHIKYSYRPGSRDYLRHLNGQAHRDAAGKEITARNVILQYVPHPYDSRGRTTPNLIGSGPIDFYSMGQRFRGTWSKSSPAAPTQFYYSDGKPIEMVYGRTWIQIVRGG